MPGAQGEELRNNLKEMLKHKTTLTETFLLFKEDKDGKPLTSDEIRKHLIVSAKTVHNLDGLLQLAKGFTKASKKTSLAETPYSWA